MMILKRVFSALVCLPLVGGCVLVTDLGRFNQQTATNPDYYDVEFSVTGMDSHINEYFEARIVDSTGVVQTRVDVKPLGGPAEAFTIPAAVQKGQEGSLRLEFYADHNNDGKFDLTPLPADHSWIRNISDYPPGADGVIRIAFDHTTTFQDLDPDKSFGVDAVIHVANVGAYMGKRLSLRVADASSKHVVGVYRSPALTAASFDARIVGIIDPAEGTKYQLEASIDDGNDQNMTAYRILGASGMNTGLVLTVDPTTAPPASDVLPPEQATQ